MIYQIWNPAEINSE